MSNAYEVTYQFSYETRTYPRNRVAYKSATRQTPTKRHRRLCTRYGHHAMTFTINGTDYCVRCHATTPRTP